MGAALGGGNQVDIAFLDQLALGQPGQGPFAGIGLALDAAQEQVGRQAGLVRQLPAQVIAQAILVAPLILLAAGFVMQLDGQARAEHGLGAQVVAHGAQVEAGTVEVLRVRPEADPGAGVASADAADHGQRAGTLAVGKGHVVLVALALDPHLQARGQGIDHGDADPVQAARVTVVAVGKLAAGMEPGEDQLHAAHALVGVDIDRHAAAVIGHLAGTVLEQVIWIVPAPQGLVDGIVDDFLGQVVGAVVSVYMPGRRRTGSRPDRTSMSAAS